MRQNAMYGGILQEKVYNLHCKYHNDCAEATLSILPI